MENAVIMQSTCKPTAVNPVVRLNAMQFPSLLLTSALLVVFAPTRAPSALAGLYKGSVLVILSSCISIVECLAVPLNALMDPLPLPLPVQANKIQMYTVVAQ